MIQEGEKPFLYISQTHNTKLLGALVQSFGPVVYAITVTAVPGVYPTAHLKVINDGDPAGAGEGQKND